MNDDKLNKPGHIIQIDIESRTTADEPNIQTKSADDEKMHSTNATTTSTTTTLTATIATPSTATSSGTTSKKRNKGSEKLVLDLNDRSKYTKEVSV